MRTRTREQEAAPGLKYDIAYAGQCELLVPGKDRILSPVRKLLGRDAG